MKKLKWIIPIVVLLSAIGGKLFIDLNESKALPAKKTTKKNSRPAKGFNTIKPIMKKYTRKLRHYGNLESITQVDVYSKYENRLLELYADVSDYVTEGQLLAQLESSELIESKKLKEAARDLTVASLNRDRVIMRGKKLIYNRDRAAYQENVIAKQEMDQAKIDYNSAIAQVRLSEAKVKEAEAAIDVVNIKIAETQIHAPMQGIIAKRYLHQGAIVRSSQPVFQIIKINELKLIINVAEKDLSEIIDKRGKARKDIRINIFIESLNKKFQGSIYKIYPSVDTKTRTISMEIRLENRHRLLKPGFYCQAEFNIAKKEQALFIPGKAVKYDEVQQKN